MSDELRHVAVAVAVIYDPARGFLLWNNKRWNGYAFPMRHMEPGDEPASAALGALDARDFPASLPKATVRSLECLGAFGYSEGRHVDTYYDYHVMEVDPGQALDPATLDPDLRFFTYDRLQAATIVTWSTRVIATALVESQEVVVAVIWRRTAAGLEFLLVHKPGHDYFFPAIRRKTHAPLEGMADQAIRFDTAYGGAVVAEYGGDAVDAHSSARFGGGRRSYRHYLCVMEFPREDLNQPGNALEQSLNAWQAAKAAAGQRFGRRGYWAWFPIADMRQDREMSSQVASVLAAAMAAVEAWERRAKSS